MARRVIQAKFFKDEHVTSVPPMARFVYIGLWCHADDQGVYPAKPRELWADILGTDGQEFVGVVMESIEALLKTQHLLFSFAVDGKPYWLVPKLFLYQYLTADKASRKYPTPPDDLLRSLLSESELAKFWKLFGRRRSHPDATATAAESTGEKSSQGELTEEGPGAETESDVSREAARSRAKSADSVLSQVPKSPHGSSKDLTNRDASGACARKDGLVSIGDVVTGATHRVGSVGSENLVEGVVSELAALCGTLNSEERDTIRDWCRTSGLSLVRRATDEFRSDLQNARNGNRRPITLPFRYLGAIVKRLITQQPADTEAAASARNASLKASTQSVLRELDKSAKHRQQHAEREQRFRTWFDGLSVEKQAALAEEAEKRCHEKGYAIPEKGVPKPVLLDEMMAVAREQMRRQAVAS